MLKPKEPSAGFIASFGLILVFLGAILLVGVLLEAGRFLQDEKPWDPTTIIPFALFIGCTASLCFGGVRLIMLHNWDKVKAFGRTTEVKLMGILLLGFSLVASVQWNTWDLLPLAVLALALVLGGSTWGTGESLLELSEHVIHR
jgi:hypothetical protein